MQATSFQQFDVPGAVSGANRALRIAGGTQLPVRVVLKNIGPSPLFIGNAANDVVTSQGPGSSTYPIDPGERESALEQARAALARAEATEQLQAAELRKAAFELRRTNGLINNASGQTLAYLSSQIFGGTTA